MRHLFIFEEFNLTISKSNIEGEGLFTKKDIPAGAKICLIADISKIDDSDNWINKYGHKINHSDKPNTEVKMRGTKCYLYSIKDIKAGEELVDDYRKIPAFFDKKIR